MSKNPKLYSHKFHQAALAYEIALSIRESKVVHINGPFDASIHDKAIFVDERIDEDGMPTGLKNKIPDKKKAIGDKGYRGLNGIVSTPNSHDPEDVRKFKSRARARQEAFNARLKTFACLKDDFRHQRPKHKIVFEAVVVICQYQMEFGSPLWDV